MFSWGAKDSSFSFWRDSCDSTLGSATISRAGNCYISSRGLRSGNTGKRPWLLLHLLSGLRRVWNHYLHRLRWLGVVAARTAARPRSICLCRVTATAWAITRLGLPIAHERIQRLQAEQASFEPLQLGLELHQDSCGPNRSSRQQCMRGIPCCAVQLARLRRPARGSR